jgi:hypothetical protein
VVLHALHETNIRNLNRLLLHPIHYLRRRRTRWLLRWLNPLNLLLLHFIRILVLFLFPFTFLLRLHHRYLRLLLWFNRHIWRHLLLGWLICWRSCGSSPIPYPFVGMKLSVTSRVILCVALLAIQSHVTLYLGPTQINYLLPLDCTVLEHSISCRCSISSWSGKSRHRSSRKTV